MNNKEAVSKKFMELIQTFKLGVLKPTEKRYKNIMPNTGSHILFYISTNGACTMGDITRVMSCSKQQASQLVDKLIKSGYVKRETDKDDRRKIWINMTENGEDVIAQIMKSIESIFIEALSALEEKDLDNFSKAIDIFDYSFKKIQAANRID
jgi:DNA-binding MarR family transcriptional regulator